MISKINWRVFFILLSFLFVSCASEKPKKTESPDILYKKAMDEYKRRKYSEAIATFYKLKYDYPAEAASVLADLRIADAHFHNKDYSEAIISYEDFRKLHPTSPYLPYVTYQLGLCHYNQILSIDRDQKHTQMALNEFYYLITHYPSSPYAQPSYEKFMDCQKRIVEHEAYVANFYYKKGKYRATINRLESAVANYPSIPLKEDILYVFLDSYIKVGQYDKAKEIYEFLIKQHPESKYAKKAKDLMIKGIDPKVSKQSLETISKESRTNKYPEKEESHLNIQNEPKGQDIQKPISSTSQIALPDAGKENMENLKINKGDFHFADASKVNREAEGQEKTKDSSSKGSRESSFKGFTFSSDKPLHITADMMEAFQKENRVVFKGHVVAKQEDITLFADEIQAFLKGEEEGGGLKRVISRGNVKITQIDRVATCDEAIFDDETNTITMLGNPKIWQGKDRIDGEKIVTHIEEERVTVYGSEERRVVAIIYPRENEGILKSKAKKVDEGIDLRGEERKEGPPEKDQEDNKAIVDEIMQFLSLWKNYWENKEIDAFISLYSPDFIYQDMDRERWKEKKRESFEKYNSIKIEIEGVNIENNGTHAKVNFLEKFRGDKFTEISSKTLWLKKIEGKWKIFREVWESL
jgi:outer membrane protein assembly factor BamD